MTVYIEKPAVNLREELASLRNQGGYEERQFYFDNLLTNGTFDADTDWTKGTGWTISGGKAIATSVTGALSIYQPIIRTAGASYKITVDVSGSSGSYSLNLNGAGTGDILTGDGNKTVNVTANTTGSIDFQIQQRTGAALTGEFDNVSIFQTDASNNVVHRMPKGWVPLHVYEDGLLQREGAANDYEVVYDGFDYYVKPAVAPSATTQTCVIGVRK